MCCSDQEAPDYSGVAAANEKAAQFAYQAAQDDLAFRRQVYAESQPERQALMQRMTGLADSQMADAATARDRSAVAWEDWNTLGRPLQSRVVGEANAYGGAADQAAKAGQAVSDIRQQMGLAQAASARALASMGVNPNSGRFAANANRNSLAEAAMAAGGANNARQGAIDKGISLRAGALSGMTGQQNVAGQQMGLGLNAGNASGANANTGFMSGLPYAQFAAGGTGSAINAAQLGSSNALGLAGLQSRDYSTQVNQPSLFGTLIGAAGQGAAAYYGAGGTFGLG
jgi:hypothetical protein